MFEDSNFIQHVASRTSCNYQQSDFYEHTVSSNILKILIMKITDSWMPFTRLQNLLKNNKPGHIGIPIDYPRHLNLGKNRSHLQVLNMRDILLKSPKRRLGAGAGAVGRERATSALFREI